MYLSDNTSGLDLGQPGGVYFQFSDEFSRGRTTPAERTAKATKIGHNRRRTRVRVGVRAAIERKRDGHNRVGVFAGNGNSQRTHGRFCAFQMLYFDVKFPMCFSACFRRFVYKFFECFFFLLNWEGWKIET